MRYNSLKDDTLRAMQMAPEYWLAWYTAKSLALVAALCGVAYLLGSKSKKRRR